MYVPLWLTGIARFGAAVADAVLLIVRRPRSIEDELRQPKRSRTMARRLTAEASLVEVLKALAAERATGRLDVRSGAKKCSLYFLFGHLFHAESGRLKGEAALHAALAWSETSWTFDSNSRLPTDETIVNEPTYKDM